MIQFFVPGTPAPQGSKRHVGGGRMIEASPRLKVWRELVAWRAALACQTPTQGPVRMRLEFVMPRPKRLGMRFEPHTVRPDTDKLARAVLDGVTGSLIRDDAQVIDLRAIKRYALPGEDPGVWITLHPRPENQLRPAAGESSLPAPSEEAS